MSAKSPELRPIGGRFRGFLPVVVDVETGGFDEGTDALLEIAVILLGMTKSSRLTLQQTFSEHIEPFPGARCDEQSLKVNGIDPYHPLRMARPEKEVLAEVFELVGAAVERNRCSRAIIVGHNAFFDLKFLNAAVARCDIKNNPFHTFSSIDTVSLGALFYGQTVLSRIAAAAKLEWDDKNAHSALYDAHITAKIFCRVFNLWQARADAAPRG